MFKKYTMVLVIFITSMAQMAWAQASMSDSQNAKIADIVSMLNANPEVVDNLHDSLKFYMTQQQVFSDLLKQNRPYMESASHTFIGDEKGEITLFNISDYSCPYCKKLDLDLEKLVKTYPQVKVVNIHVPIKEHTSKVNSSSYALNVWNNDRDKFQQVNDLLVAKPGTHNAVSLEKIARRTGTEQYLNTDESIDDQMIKNMSLFDNLGLRGTPALIIGNELTPGYVPYETLENMVKAQLLKDKS